MSPGAINTTKAQVSPRIRSINQSETSVPLQTDHSIESSGNRKMSANVLACLAFGARI